MATKKYKFLPHEDYWLESALTVEELQSRLADVVAPPERRVWKLLRNATKLYMGTLTENQFTIFRIIQYRNSFLPQIVGQFQATEKGSQIHIQMKLHLVVMIFLGMWLNFVAGFGLLLLFSMFSTGQFIGEIFIPIFMLIFLYALSYFAFKGESKKSKKFLAALFEAQESTLR